MNWDDLANMVGQDPGHQIRRPNFLSRFAYGARWQREKLRTDKAVERVAEYLYRQDFHSPMSDHSSWCTNKDCDLIDGYRVDARHLINVLLREA